MDEDGSAVGRNRKGRKDELRGNDEGAGREPWEQLPSEPPLAYHVFGIYLLMGPERTIRAAVLKWFKESKSAPNDNAVGRFIRLATRWRWQERADWYWRKERKRAEQLLQQRRDAIYKRYAALSEKVLATMEGGLRNVKVEKHTKGYVEALAKLLEIQRIVFGDSDEERKRRGRPPEDAGSLPAIEDRLKPPDEETPIPAQPEGK